MAKIKSCIGSRYNTENKQHFYGAAGVKLITNVPIAQIYKDGSVLFQDKVPDGPWFSTQREASLYFEEVVLSQESDSMNMSEREVIEMFQDFQLIAVKFDYHRPSGKTCVYKAPKDMKIEVGDLLVVHVESTDQAPYKTVEVCEVNVKSSDVKAHRWVVDKIETTGYLLLMENEKQVGEILRRAREAREKKIRMADLQEFMTPEDLAIIKSLTSGPQALEASKTE